MLTIHVERNELTDALAWVARSLPARAVLPALAGVLIESTEHGVTLSGYDLEVATQAQVAATVSEGGRALVSGRLLTEIARTLPGAPVELTVDGNRLELRCGSVKFKLPLLSVDDYPALPELPEETGRIAAPSFAAAVSQVAAAAGRDESLPVLTGIRVELDGERLTLIATDRYRLAVRELRWRPHDPQLQRVALVPARTLAEAAKAMSGSGVDAELAIALGGPGAGPPMAGFATATRRTVTRLLEGEFPAYRKLLPSQTETTASAEVSTAALVEAVNRVKVVLNRLLPVKLSFGPDELLVEAHSDDSEAREELPMSYEGEPMTIAFNPQYLLDGLGSIDSDTTRLAFSDPQRPAILTGKAGDDGLTSAEHLYLIMPVRLPGL